MSRKFLGMAVLAAVWAVGCEDDSVPDPTIADFRVAGQSIPTGGPIAVFAGNPVVASWTAENHEDVRIESCLGFEPGAAGFCPGGFLTEIGVSNPLAGNNSATFVPYADMRLRLVATGGRHVTVRTDWAELDVRAENPDTGPRATAFYATPSVVAPGETATLFIRAERITTPQVQVYDVTGRPTSPTGTPLGALDVVDGRVNSTLEVRPTNTRLYLLKEAGDGGVFLATTRVTVENTVPQVPVIRLFAADPALVSEGEEFELAWDTTGATGLTLSPEVTGFDGSEAAGTVTVTAAFPAGTTGDTAVVVYRLTATNGGYTATAEAPVTVTGGPRVVSFTATPTTVLPGDISTLAWDTARATSVSIAAVPADPSLPATFAVDGTAAVTPAVTTVYTLTATGAGTTAPAVSTVTVTVDPLASVDSFTATPTDILTGDGSTLAWATSDVTGVTITAVPADGSLPATFAVDGTAVVTPAATTVYTLTATRSGVPPATATVTVTVHPRPAVGSFTATPTVIPAGGTGTQLAWTTTNATGVTIAAVPPHAGIPATLPATGTLTVNPAADTTYTLTAQGALASTATASTSVLVVAVGSLVVTEVMYNPAAVADNLGEWFEILNTSTRAIPLNGLVLIGGGTESHTIAAPALTIPAGGYLVLGNNTNTTTNGGVTVAYAFPTSGAGAYFLANSTDTIRLSLGGVVIDEVTYTDPVAPVGPLNGYSLQLNASTLTAVANDVATNWCPAAAAATYGAGDHGTPGAVNRTCP